MEGGRWRLPGGAAPTAVWMDLSGGAARGCAGLSDRALLRAHGGLVTYVLEVVATLDGQQQRGAARARVGRCVDVASPRDGPCSTRSDPPSEFWTPGERPFWRPADRSRADARALHVDAQGRLALPGGRKLWELVFGEGELTPTPDKARDAWRRSDAGVDRLAHWRGLGMRRRADQAIALRSRCCSRRADLTGAPASRRVAVVSALWGYGRFPQLFRVLERIGVADAARLAAMVRQAVALSAPAAGAPVRRIQWQSLVIVLSTTPRGRPA